MKGHTKIGNLPATTIKETLINERLFLFAYEELRVLIVKKWKWRFAIVPSLVLIISAVVMSSILCSGDLGILNGGVSMTDEERQMLSPEEVLRGFFQCWSAKDQNGMDGFLDEPLRGAMWDFYNQRSLGIVSMRNSTEFQVKSELESGDNGNMVKQAAALGYQIETFIVKFESTFFDNNISPWTDGVYEYSYIIVKKAEDSPWVIYSYGFG